MPRTEFFDERDKLRKLWISTAPGAREGASVDELMNVKDAASWRRILAASADPASAALGEDDDEEESSDDDDESWRSYGIFNGASWCYQTATIQALGLLGIFPAALADVGVNDNERL